MSKKAFNISAELQNNLAVVKIEGYISSWDRVAANFKAQVDALVNAGIKDFTVYINSEGGSVFEANEIVNELKRFKGTSTAMLGALCASAATVIAISCNKIIASANTSFMIHKPSTYVSGNAAEIEAQLKALKNIEKQYLAAYAKKTGLSEDTIESLWKEDYWMDAEEAREKHFVDEIDSTTEASISAADILAIKAVGYKNMPEFKATTTTPTITTPNPDIMKDKLVLILAAMPGLTITAATSDNELLGYVEAIKAKAVLADSLQAKLDALTKEADKAKRDAILNAAEAKKKFTPAQRGFYEAMLVKDFEATKTHIDGLPELTPLSAAANTGAAAESRANWTYADYQEKDPKALAELAETNNEAFEKLFNAHYAQK